MPDSSSRVRHFVAHKPNTIVTRIGLNLAYYRPVAAQAMMAGCIRTVDPTPENVKFVGPPLTVELTIGGIVIHVALPRMRLAPVYSCGVTYWRFGKIGRAWILRWVRSLIATVTRCDVPVWVWPLWLLARRWERACKWIHPRARTYAVLVSI